MRQLRYSVAASLDGFIAGPNGEYDWIPMDPDIDFAALYATFGAVVMGRRSHEALAAMGGDWAPALPTFVYSRSLAEGERNGATFVRDAVAHLRDLKTKSEGKPIWLWGGGVLFAELAGAGLVDGVDLAVVPVLLGRGIRLAPLSDGRVPLTLRAHRVYGKTGTVFLEYDVAQP
jgi:dihydrofolate reductase